MFVYSVAAGGTGAGGVGVAGMVAKEHRDSTARPPTNLYGKRIRVITIWTLHLLQQACDQRGLLKIYTHNGWTGWTRGQREIIGHNKSNL